MGGRLSGAEGDWRAARLIPTAGIKGLPEQETRGTSALLAVMQAVPDFGHALLKQLGAPKGDLTAYTEVRLKDGNGKTHIPDGAIVVQRGKKRWSCLVEVKTSRAAIETDQVTRYLEMAREHGFDGLLTISNQIRTDSDGLPYEVDRRKVGKLTVRHTSWWRIQTEAILQHRHRGVEDPDQAFILNELIRYLEDEKSGASGFEDMGEEWTAVRAAARNDTLRSNDPHTGVIASRWFQFVEYLALRLSQELGVEVSQPKKRRMNPAEQVSRATQKLAEDGYLEGRLNVPGAIGPLEIEANLRTARVTTSVEINAPEEGRPKTRINWILRQLKEAPDDLRIEVRFAQVRGTMSELLGDCRSNPDCLLLDDDPKREPRSFLLAWSKPLARKRGRKEGSFVAETRAHVVEFYREIVQDLTPPPSKPPRLPEKPESPGLGETSAADQATDSKAAPPEPTPIHRGESERPTAG